MAFTAVAVGSYDTYTPLPSGWPSGTEVVDIAPGDGESGYFLVCFILPTGVMNVPITDAGNVDDIGRVFVNSNAVTQSLGSFDEVSEHGDVTFSSGDASFFQAGTNTLMISDANTCGGPSGAVFYATVNFTSAVPEPAPVGMLLCALAAAGLLRFVRRSARFAATA